MVPSDFGHWLAGFIDGEGCFIIQQVNHTDGKPGNYMARFMLRVRDDDRGVLEEILRQTGLGGLIDEPERRNGNTGGACYWHVSAKRECLGLVALLDRYPLRAKKARDYALWRVAVLAWSRVQNPTRDPAENAAIWRDMAALKTQLINTRVYIEAPA